MREDGFRPRPGRIREGNKGARRSRSYVAQVMRAAKKAGHTGKRFDGSRARKRGATFGRGRRAALLLSRKSPARRVVVMARIVRHRGHRFRSAPLARHITYLKREGVTRDGKEARLFDAKNDDVDGKAFAERCEDDRHHFRFTVSPEDAGRMTDLRAFTRDLMKTAERDFESRLDWVAVDHWNTDNPHVHVLVRGKASDGKDLVISRDYVSHGFRIRAGELVTLELGRRSDQEIRAAGQKEVEAERWTGLDKALREIADDGAGIADLRPGAGGHDPERRSLLVGRASKLERLGLAEQISPGCWTLKPSLEQTLRDLSIRGDIIKTMHRAMSGAGRKPDVAGFALHSEPPGQPITGRLAARGLYDELSGSAYAIIEGTDGRTHHLRFSNLEMTGDADKGAIVETRAYEDDKGHKQFTLAVRSDLSVEAQVSASGATWLDRQLLAKDPSIGNSGFGAEARQAMDARVDYLVKQGLAHRQGERVVFGPDLLGTLRQRELDEVSSTLAADTGLAYRPINEGERIAGTYRRRVTLASGRFAMIDDGLGFQLVPWRPALDAHLGRQVQGIGAGAGGVDWTLGKKRGLSL